MTLKRSAVFDKKNRKGTLDETKDNKIKQNKKENGQRLILKLNRRIWGTCGKY